MAKKQQSNASSIAERVMQPGYPATRDNVIKDAKLLAASVISHYGIPSIFASIGKKIDKAKRAATSKARAGVKNADNAELAVVVRRRRAKKKGKRTTSLK